MIAAVVLFLQAPPLIELIDRVSRIAGSEPVEYGIDTRLKLAQELEPKFREKARRQLQDAQAALAGVEDKAARNKWRGQIVEALAPLDFDEALRLAKSMDPDREHDYLAEAYDKLYERLKDRDRNEFIQGAIGAGGFRLQCAANSLRELRSSDRGEALLLFARISDAFPDSPNEKDIAYLSDRIKDVEWSDSDVVKSAGKKVGEAIATMPKSKDTSSGEGHPKMAPLMSAAEIWKLPYSDALEQATALQEAGDRADALIALSRREDLTPHQRGRVASEALTAVGKMKLSDDRLVGLSMLSRDFVKRQEYSSAALAAQMLLESYTQACGCGASSCKVEGTTYDCVELVDAYADYLHELDIQPDSMGLRNVSLEARMTIFEIARLLGGKGGPSLLPH